MSEIKAYCKDKNLVLVLFENDSYCLKNLKIKDLNESNKLSSMLEDAFKGKDVDFTQYIDLNKISSTEFEKKVYTETMKIQKGEVKTYKEIGELIGTEGYRAIGNALNKNPIAIAIPCHRVVGSNMKLTGFRVGTDIKKQMLINEGIKFKNNKVVRN